MIDKNVKPEYILDPARGVLPYHLGKSIAIYKAVGMTLTEEVKRELESAEYGACRFKLNGKSIVFRVAKSTPIKAGQFVTIWQRPHGVTMPLDSTDLVDFVVIDSSNEQCRGQFILIKKH